MKKLILACVKIKEKQNILFLSIIFLLFLYGSVETYMILIEDNIPLLENAEYYTSVKYYNLVKNFKILDLINLYFFNYRHEYPPFIMLQTLPFYFLFVPSQDTAVLSNILNLFIILFSTYFIGKKAF